MPAQEPAPSRNDGPRVNHQINVPQVRLVREDGSMVGVVTTREAISMAADAGLDLVEVSPNAAPPVCKILDLGKFKYEEQKRKNEARKKQKVIEVKEIKLRPGIDIHDYEVKMRAVHRFLEEGDKVKVTMRFRGREMAHQELGVKVLDRVKADLDADREGRIAAQDGRPPDDHGDLAEVGGTRWLERTRAPIIRRPLCYDTTVLTRSPPRAPAAWRCAGFRRRGARHRATSRGRRADRAAPARRRRASCRCNSVRTP